GRGRGRGGRLRARAAAAVPHPRDGVPTDDRGVLGLERVLGPRLQAVAAAVGVDGATGVEPRDEVAGGIGRVALGEIGGHERYVFAPVQVDRGRDQRARRLDRLLDEGDDAVVVVHTDDGVLTGEDDVAAVADRDGAPVGLPGR